MDTHSFNFNAIKAVFNKKNAKFSEEIFSKYFVGRSLNDALTLLLNDLGRSNEISEWIKLKKDHDKFFAQEIIGYGETLDFIHKNHDKFRFAIATGCRFIHLDLTFKKYGLKDFFEITLTSEDISKGKPDPEIYLSALKKLNVMPEEAVVIEDSPAGISAACAANIKCIALTQTHLESELMDADLIVPNLLDKRVIEFLKKK